jgi:hypothetical protein
MDDSRKTDKSHRNLRPNITKIILPWNLTVRNCIPASSLHFGSGANIRVGYHYMLKVSQTFLFPLQKSIQFGAPL